MTPYQRTHRPTSRVEVLCTETERINGACPACRREPLGNSRPHKPNATGSLGWVARYADGSFVLETPTGEKAS